MDNWITFQLIAVIQKHQIVSWWKIIHLSGVTCHSQWRDPSEIETIQSGVRGASTARRYWIFKESENIFDRVVEDVLLGWPVVRADAGDFQAGFQNFFFEFTCMSSILVIVSYYQILMAKISNQYVRSYI